MVDVDNFAFVDVAVVATVAEVATIAIGAADVVFVGVAVVAVIETVAVVAQGMFFQRGEIKDLSFDKVCFLFMLPLKLLLVIRTITSQILRCNI